VSTILSAPAIWRSDKMVPVTGHTRHRHSPSPISAGFKPFNAGTTLIFGPSALARRSQGQRRSETRRRKC
jgi:hypothetical protein